MPPTLLPHQTVLDRHVRLFNEGVQTGNFGPMLAHFAPDAALFFEGIPVGPFHGREAIAEAYSVSPPTDQIIPHEASEHDNIITAPFAWASEPEGHGGTMLLEMIGDTIQTLTVRYSL
jgi:steroid Delta-isomerase